MSQINVKILLNRTRARFENTLRQSERVTACARYALHAEQVSKRLHDAGDRAGAAVWRGQAKRYRKTASRITIFDRAGGAACSP